MRIFKEATFEAAHRLPHVPPGHRCHNLHGHNYRVRIYAGADELDATGMVLDFVKLKAALMNVILRFDHHNINEVPPFDTLNPTAEHVACYIAEEVAAAIDDGRVRITECHLWETDRSCAIYTR